jgi:hypothetical protein
VRDHLFHLILPQSQLLIPLTKATHAHADQPHGTPLVPDLAAVAVIPSFGVVFDQGAQVRCKRVYGNCADTWGCSVMGQASFLP